MWIYENLCKFMCIYVHLCEFMWIYVNLSVHGGGYFIFFTFLWITLVVDQSRAGVCVCPTLFRVARVHHLKLPPLVDLWKIWPRKSTFQRTPKVPGVYMTFLIFWPKMENNFSQAKDWSHLICATPHYTRVINSVE